MARVKVYKVKSYNINEDQFVVSRRMATREGATAMHGEVLEDTEIEIDDSQLERGCKWTPIDFRP